MTDLHPSLENRLRGALLDVIHDQWRELGVPFAARLGHPLDEVVDPEALLWCSLELLPTAPGLRAAVVAWHRARGAMLVRQRLRRVLVPDDPRTSLWHALDGGGGGQGSAVPARPCHGLEDVEAVHRCAAELTGRRTNAAPPANRGPATGGPAATSPAAISPAATSPATTSPTAIGPAADRPTTMLLRARALLGADARHLMLAYLLGRRGGGRLRDLASWSTLAYRTIADTAARWEDAGVIELDHGFARLRDPAPWRTLLRLPIAEPKVIDWFAAFGSIVELLRALAEARRTGTDIEAPLVRARRTETAERLSSSVRSDSGDAATLTRLRETLR